MSNAYRTGAAMAQLSVAGLGGLGAAPKKGKKKGKRVAPRQSSGMKRVVNAFIAGKSDQNGCKWDPDTGNGKCDYATNGVILKIHGREVARRVTKGGMPLDFTGARAAKQIQVCAQQPFLPDTKDSKERKINADMLGAVNAIMDTVKTGIRFRDVKDYEKGFREVLSTFRLGAGGGATVIPTESAGGIGQFRSCVFVELTDEMRQRAMVNALNEDYAEQLETLKKEVELPIKSRKSPLTHDELLAVMARTQRELATAAGDPAAVQAAFIRLREAVKNKKSLLNFSF